MKKLTKIIATIGLSSESREILTDIINLGVNVVRFNLKHNETSWHAERIDLVKEISKELGREVGVLIDLQGPEIRINISNEKELEIGDRLILGNDFTISHPTVIPHLKRGQRIVIDDGRLNFIVDEEGKNSCIIVSQSKGVLKTRKTLNVPGASFPLPVLTEKDLEAIKMAKNHGVDFVALSFVRSAKDIRDLKKVMEQEGVVAHVISKIEAKMAIDNIDEIIKESDGIMVARGDLGIELPIEEVPYYQKIIIKKCLEHGIPVITATQMLHSMVEKPYPTRAEISDMANAAYDFTDCVMLSEETAMGAYPKRAVEMMKKTVKFSETHSFVEDTRSIFNFNISDVEDMFCDTAYNLYLILLMKNHNIGGFITFTQTGRTAVKLSRYRPQVPIYAFAYEEKVRDRLSLNYGVFPFVQPKIFEKNRPVRIEDMKEAFEFLMQKGLVEKNKNYILLHGDSWMIEGKTSTVKIVNPSELL